MGGAALQKHRVFRVNTANGVPRLDPAGHTVGERRADIHVLAEIVLRDPSLVMKHAALTGEVDHVPCTRLTALADLDHLEQRFFEELLMDLIVRITGGEHDVSCLGVLLSVCGIGDRIGVFAGLERVFPGLPVRYLAVKVRERNGEARRYRLVQIGGRDEDVHRCNRRFHYAHGAVPMVRRLIGIHAGVLDAQVVESRLAEENGDSGVDVAHVIQRPPFGLVGAAHLDMALSGAVRQRKLRTGRHWADGQAGIVVHHGGRFVYRQIICLIIRPRQDKAEESLFAECVVVHHDGEILPVRERAKPRDLRRGHSGGLVVIAEPLIHKEIDRPGAAHEARYLATEVIYVHIR